MCLDSVIGDKNKYLRFAGSVVSETFHCVISLAQVVVCTINLPVQNCGLKYHSFIHSFIHSFTHSLIHSLIHSCWCNVVHLDLMQACGEYFRTDSNFLNNGEFSMLRSECLESYFHFHFLHKSYSFHTCWCISLAIKLIALSLAAHVVSPRKNKICFGAKACNFTQWFPLPVVTWHQLHAC